MFNVSLLIVSSQKKMLFFILQILRVSEKSSFKVSIRMPITFLLFLLVVSPRSSSSIARFKIFFRCYSLYLNFYLNWQICLQWKYTEH